MRTKSILVGLLVFLATAAAQAEPTTYARYQFEGTASYGVVDGSQVHRLTKAPYLGGQKTGRSVSLSKIKLLAPVEPSKVLAVGLNYQSHAGMSGASKPEIFIKLPTSVIGPNQPIPFPKDARNLHYEGEMVLVIGKRIKDASLKEAQAAIFGVTAGNDVSERGWQSGDLQWWRAKGSDGFAPLGPYLVSGLDFDNLLVTTRLNGEVRQQEKTDHLIHDSAAIVSFVSRHVTLMPGDVIFTGTPGSTRAMDPGDVVEVEVEGVGVLKNRIARQ